jgi:hypothetical protein
MPDGRLETIAEPLIPLLDTTLLTNAPGEPRVGRPILAETLSADRIDMVIAFVRRSGIATLLPALRDHCAKHESEMPMAITWRLQHSLPGDLFAAFAAAVA